MAVKTSAVMADKITANNNEAFETILNKIERFTGGRSPEDHKPDRIANDEGDDQSPTYSRDWLVDDVYYTTRTKPKSDVILLKMYSGEAWFANASVNGTPFKFLMDSGAGKSVMSSK